MFGMRSQPQLSKIQLNSIFCSLLIISLLGRKNMQLQFKWYRLKANHFESWINVTIIKYHIYTFRANVLFMCFLETDALMVWNSFCVGTLSVVLSTFGRQKIKNVCAKPVKMGVLYFRGCSVGSGGGRSPRQKI